MAHELHIKNGKASMMYVGRPPWHGLGTKLDSPATSAEAMKAAGLGWRVRKVPVYAGDETALVPVARRFAVVPEDRWGSDTCPVFGLVGEQYVPLQNEEAFGFFDSIVGMKAAMYHTAGALGDGARVWILAKLPGQIHVVGEDVADKYLLLANGHNGTTAVQMRFTPVRVVCQNTLTLALNDPGRRVSVHHGWNFWRRMIDAKAALGMIQNSFAQLETEFKQMASVQMTAERLNTYLKAVFPNPRSPATPTAVGTTRTNRMAALRLFETGTGNTLPGVDGTLWAAFNGVTDYVDHKLGRYTPEQRLQSVWFGKGCQIKTRAYEVARLLASGAEMN